MGRPLCGSLVLVPLLGLATPVHAQPVVGATHCVACTSLDEVLPRLGRDGIGPYVVYSAAPFDSEGYRAPFDVFYRRLHNDGSPAGEPIPVATGPTDDQVGDAYGDYIVYASYSPYYPDGGRVVVYRISTASTYVITSAPIPDIWSLRVNGNYLVWTGATGPTAWRWNCTTSVGWVLPTSPIGSPGLPRWPF